MTKVKKRIIILSLFLGLLLSICGFFYSSNKANASTFTGDGDGFTTKITGSLGLDELSNTFSPTEMNYLIYPKSTEFNNLHNYIGTYNIEDHKMNYFLFEFTVYADYSSKDQTGTKLISPIAKFRILFAMTYGGGDDYMHSFLSYKKYSGFSESVEFGPSQRKNEIDVYEKGEFRKSYWKDLLLSDGFIESYHETTKNTGLKLTEDGFIFFRIKNPQRDCKYGVKLTYDFDYATKHTFFYTYHDTKKGEYDTGSLSFVDYATLLLSQYESDEALDAVFNQPGSASILREYIETPTEKTVNVSYLEQYEDSPFATMTTKTITLVTRNGYELEKADFYNAFVEQLGLDPKNIDCVLGSFLSSFTSKDGINYRANYLTGGRTRVKTVDGNDCDWFMDINQSFYEFYYPFDLCSLLESNRYEFYLNNLVYSKYPELSLKGITAKELYGYWGFVGVPKGHTINSFITYIEGTETYFDSVYGVESYDALLTYDQYNELMTTYKYTWLSTQWSALVNLLGTDATNATFYMMYLEKNDNALIGEGGQTDYEDGSVLEEKVQDGWDNVKDIFSSVFSGKGLKIGLIAVLGVLVVFAVLKTVRVVGKAKYSNKPKKNKKRGK